MSEWEMKEDSSITDNLLIKQNKTKNKHDALKVMHDNVKNISNYSYLLNIQLKGTEVFLDQKDLTN